MAETTRVVHLGDGLVRVDHDGRQDLAFVAGPPGDRWIFWNGEVFRQGGQRSIAPHPGTKGGPYALTAPMPARVVKIAATAGTAVKKGDTLVVLEAMKMELPVRAIDDATVTAVRCREGELVPADGVLIELE